ncbi:MAG: N-6 DNA methylase [Elusimicrobia bacterium]|nr:N-6 DNA methylase [Elusimicrobiota bacterium]
MAKRNNNGNGKRLVTQQSVNSVIKSICDIMRRSNCAGALQYVPELTWILFLRILDEREAQEAEHAQTRFPYKTGSTRVLFLQHVIDSLKPGGRCGIVLDEGVLFRANETAFIQTKKKLLDDCDLWCILSLPPGTFMNAGAGVKTNLLFFTKGKPTEKICYYDLKAVNPHAKTQEDTRAPEELLNLIESKSQEISQALALLKKNNENH